MPHVWDLLEKRQGITHRRGTVCDDIPDDLKPKIKFLHVFDMVGSDSKLIVTHDDLVYGVGGNNRGQLGSGPSQRDLDEYIINQNERDDRSDSSDDEQIYIDPNKTPWLISELCGQRIERFIIGSSFVLGVNAQGDVYSWGCNSRGECARYTEDDDDTDHKWYLKPDKIAHFVGLTIIDISCGDEHSLALTTDGHVYGWGSNVYGQLGLGKLVVSYKPVQITFPENMEIKYIYCYRHASFAVNVLGRVFSWGVSWNYQLGHAIKGRDKTVRSPLMIKDLNDIKMVSLTPYLAYFIANDGSLYYCGKFSNSVKQKTPVVKGLVVDQLSQAGTANDVCAIRANKILQLYDNNKHAETDHVSFIDFYANAYNITYNTINPNMEIEYTSDDLERIKNTNRPSKETNEDSEIDYKDQDNQPCETNQHDQDEIRSNFRDLFDQLLVIGTGGFGTVFKVKHKFDEQIYAIKRVKFTGYTDERKEKVLKELKSLVKVRSVYCVQYINSWPEGTHLYIQMEYCSQSLRNVLEVKAQVFERHPEGAMSSVEYYITCEIFRQIVESVQYLHELNPPLIHRDLKPDNILVDDMGRNGRFVKLCDFGLATDHEIQSMSHTKNVGTYRYMAPELGQSKYTIKVDIFSLGIIGMELFDVYLNTNDTTKYENHIISNYIKAILDICLTMISHGPSIRPTCSDILKQSPSWSIKKDIVKSQKNEFDKIIDKFTSADIKVFNKILVTKMNMANTIGNRSINNVNLTDNMNTAQTKLDSILTKEHATKLHSSKINNISSIRAKFEKLGQSSNTNSGK